MKLKQLLSLAQSCIFHFLPSRVRFRELFLLSIFIFSIVSGLDSVAHAQASIGGQLLEGTIDNIGNMNESWREIFEETFLEPKSVGIWESARLVGQLSFSIGAIIFIIRTVPQIMRDNSIRELISPVVVFGFIVFLIGGQAMPAVRISYGAILIKDSIRDQVAKQVVIGTNLTDALSDNLIQQQAKSAIAQKAEVCNQISARPVILPSAERPRGAKIAENPLTSEQEAYYAKLECYDSLNEYIKDVQDEVLGGCDGVCEYSIRFLQRAGNSLSKDLSDLREAATNKDILGTLGAGSSLLSPQSTLLKLFLGDASIQIARIWLSIAQFIFVFSIQTTYFLLVLTLPVALGLAVIPYVPNNTLFLWCITLFQAFLTEVYYVILVGLSATLIARTSGGEFTDVAIPLIYGIVAPFVSFRLAKGQADAAAAGTSNMLVGGGVAALSAVPFVGSAVAGFNSIRNR